MTSDDVKATLLSVLNDVQVKCGLPSPPLLDGDVPSKVLPKFDSTVWPAVTSRLARRLDIAIPHDVHIFGGKNKGPLLTIAQTVDLVMKKHKPKTLIAIAAE